MVEYHHDTRLPHSSQDISSHERLHVSLRSIKLWWSPRGQPKSNISHCKLSNQNQVQKRFPPIRPFMVSLSPQTEEDEVQRKLFLVARLVRLIHLHDSHELDHDLGILSVLGSGKPTWGTVRERRLETPHKQIMTSNEMHGHVQGNIRVSERLGNQRCHQSPKQIVSRCLRVHIRHRKRNAVFLPFHSVLHHNGQHVSQGRLIKKRWVRLHLFGNRIFHRFPLVNHLSGRFATRGNTVQRRKVLFNDRHPKAAG